MGLAIAAALSVRPAQALLTYNIFEATDGNVVVQTDGSLTLPTPVDIGFCGVNGGIRSIAALICTGPDEDIFAYSISGPQRFNGSVFRVASSASGISTALSGVDSLFLISKAYVSGTPIISSATFNDTTLKGLGFTTTGLIGTWTLDDTDDQIQVVLTEVPGPLPLVGVGAAFAFSRKLRRRMTSSKAITPFQS